MKLNRTIILAGAVLVMAASCKGLNQLPQWSDADNFAAFDKTQISVSEDAGSVRIPVTIASLNPVKTTVVYSVDAQNEKCTAVEGTNFSLKDPSAVLSFDNDARTAYIELNITPIHGDAGYTGDKSIILKLDSANGVKIGFAKSCEIVISDQDHPLASILGQYSATGYGTFTFEKDPTDVTIIHCRDIFTATQNWCKKPIDIIGQVSADKSQIVIPLPVDFGYTYSNGENLKVYAADASKAYLDMASITLVKTDTGFKCEEYSLITYIKGAGYVEWPDPPFNLIKQ